MSKQKREEKPLNHLDIEKIIDVELNSEMKRAYIDYSMSVIVGRALPDVRDGLKPVHRRILYTMYEDGLTPDKAYRKSATTVGDVLGRYHPHGDSSVYDAMVRMAQPFSLRYTMVDGHGNFGSVDGDPAAAYRYTEARLSKIALEMLADIDKETVDFQANFDGYHQEPSVLPSRIPHLLVNGSNGIAVGMTTNIPPHNLGEVIDAVIEVIDNPEATLADLMEHIKGPDFPTAGVIMGMAGIRAAYSTGKGHLKVRAKTEIEEFDNGRFRIVATELPYMVNKARLIEHIADLVKNKTIEGITHIQDESSREGIRVVIELSRTANPQVVLNMLFKHTQMQSTFGVILLALVDNKPKTLSLRDILDQYIKFQKDVIRRRTAYELKKAEARAHILEGLRIALDHIDEIIRIIRTSYNDAKQRLMDTFGMSEVQAQAVLDMRLARLQGLEREKIDNEYNELMKKIAYCKEVLESDALVAGILKDELCVIKEKYGDPRRTEIVPVDDEIDIEDLIPVEDCAYTLTHRGYIKRMPVSVYRSQNRGGRGVSAMKQKEEDFVETMFTASSHDWVLFFTTRGRMYRMKGYQVPESGRTAVGMNIVNLIAFEPDEKVTAMLSIKEFDDEHYLVMATRNGVVKRIALSRVDSARKAGVRAIGLDDDDELISVMLADEKSEIFLATRNGMAIKFAATDIRATGREAGGVYGIELRDGDYLIGAATVKEGKDVLTVTEKGFGKRTEVEEYRLQNRYGKGIMNYNIGEKTGEIASVIMVDDNDDVMIISDDGVIIRMPARDISRFGRVTKGVILMRLGENVKVISVAAAPHEEEEEAEEAVEATAEESVSEE
ncbi:MAG: DNA gyrase subunit A [Oscillospiraceae bacterium]|nr:DNA gyrase subunit A [Oscillospiraceae bacterium]